jgi:aspartyl-tRNA(Asn)/glutamyl-tRNA(Gln) amidotransferase subunit B
VDYNRSGVPLLEIVADHTRNPLRSVKEARTFLEKLRQILRYIGVSDCIIEKGQFRCDVNVSIRPKGSEDFGNRAEVKNMTSFRFIMEALEYEIQRQSALQSSGEVLQETRLFDEEKRITIPMRSKEDAPDYRYFPDPDLVEIEIDQEFVQRIEKTLTELPDQKVSRFVEEFEIPRNDALILTKDKSLADYFGACASHCHDRKKLSRWMIQELLRRLNDASLPVEKCPVTPKNFSRLVNLLIKEEITDKNGRAVLEEMFKTTESPKSIIDRKGYKPIQDVDVLEGILEDVMAEHPEAVSQIREGKRQPVNFLIGQVMRKTEGRANPKKVTELVHNKFKH